MKHKKSTILIVTVLAMAVVLLGIPIFGPTAFGPVCVSAQDSPCAVQEATLSALAAQATLETANYRATITFLQTSIPPTETPPVFEPIVLEGENGIGPAQFRPRSEASEQATAYLEHSGDTLTFQFNLPGDATVGVQVRYSNDNFGPLETVSIEIDDQNAGQFSAQDTGNNGFGWNVFLVSPTLGPVALSSGAHTLVVSATGGDGYGVEIDQVTIVPSSQ